MSLSPTASLTDNRDLPKLSRLAHFRFHFRFLVHFIVHFSLTAPISSDFLPKRALLNTSALSEVGMLSYRRRKAFIHLRAP